MNDVTEAVEGYTCPAQRALRHLDAFLADPMCGQCFPCALGTYEARTRLESMTRGEGTDDDVRVLERIAAAVLEGSKCRKGKDAARFLAEAIATPGFGEHAAGVCQDRECRSLTTYAVASDICVRCGACKAACVNDAIFGEPQQAFRAGYPAFEIRQRRCERCGECAAACPHGALRATDVALARGRSR